MRKKVSHNNYKIVDKKCKQTLAEIIYSNLKT